VLVLTDHTGGLIVRGDSFTTAEPVLRCAHRQWCRPGNPDRSNTYGLRLARTVR
jgi:hypothetical protein